MKHINIEKKIKWIREVAEKNYSIHKLAAAIKNCDDPERVFMECLFIFLFYADEMSLGFQSLGKKFLAKCDAPLLLIIEKHKDEKDRKKYPVCLEIFDMNDFLISTRNLAKKKSIARCTNVQLAYIIHRTCKTGYTIRTIINKLKDLE